MPTTRRTAAPKRPAAKPRAVAKPKAAPGSAELNRALKAIEDGLDKAQDAASNMRTSVDRQRKSAVTEVERLIKQAQREGRKLEKTLRSDLDSVLPGRTSAAKKPAARKPAAKPAARKPAAKKPAARKPAARKPAAKKA